MTDETAVWRRMDEHTNRITALEVKNAETTGQMSLLHTTCQNLQVGLIEHGQKAEKHAEKVEAALGTITTRIESIRLENAENRGKGMARWQLWTMGVGACTIVGLVLKVLGVY